MIPEAMEALRQADIIVGYKTYVSLIKDMFPSKTFISKGMRQEVERCRIALEKARSGAKVALISSGDAGIYGMAGLALELCKEDKIQIALEHGNSHVGATHASLLQTENVSQNQVGADFKASPTIIRIRIIPGVSALNAAASLLGAPIMHDFASISLSDHLTPWELIEKRLDLASQGDFIIALYNPRSATRPHLLELAIGIIKKHKPPTTPVGIVWRAMRKAQKVLVCNLDSVPFEAVDMHSVVIVGNSQTYIWKGLMITPRGYHVRKIEKDMSELSQEP